MLNFLSKYIYIISNRLVVRLLFLCLILFQFEASSQSEKRVQRWFTEARQNYISKRYQGTIERCNKILKVNPKFIQAHLLLADLYNDLDSTTLEISHLQEVRKFSNVPLVLFRLGEANYSTGNYKEALIFYNEYNKDTSISEIRKNEVLRKIENCSFAIQSIKNPVQFKPERLSNKINSVNDEYWPTLTIDKGKLVFTRLVKELGKVPQEDFFIAEFDSLGWGRASPIVEINTLQNEGAQTISADGKLLFFTACNRPLGKGSCDIYYSRFEKSKWSTPVNAGSTLNSEAWDAQPTFSSDNRLLYFSSSRPGGKGKKDIWCAEFLGFANSGEIRWKRPKNLGESINTEGDEISPFIHPNNKSFYFVSNLHTGMGGFDIFQTEIKSDTLFSKVKNLGYPINTFNDEQGLFISSDGVLAYFASKRNNKTGLDIYSFELDETIRPEPITYIKAKVIDSKNLYDPFIFTIELNPVKIGAEMNLYNIYFETDSFTILPESESELQKLTSF